MDNTQKTIISLIKSALYKTQTVIPSDFDGEKAERIIRRHNIYGLIYFGLCNSKAEIPKWLKTKFYSRTFLLENLWHKGDEIREAFLENGIEFIPLKGIVLKDLYPSPLMRSMSDIDILIREKDYKRKIKPLMMRLGYTEGTESDHELHWEKNGNAIELHKRIIPSYNKDFYKIIGDGWEWVQDNGYAYVFTHFAKHYRDSGIGITHLVDLEVLRSQATDKGLKDLHLDRFYDNVQRTLDCWFRDGEYDEITERITDTIFDSGEYGTQETSVKSQNLKKVNGAGGDYRKARFKDFIIRIFPPYGAMKIRNPILKKLPILLPFFWLWRIITAPFKGKIKRAYRENKAIMQDKSGYKEELNSVGLDFWF